MWSFRVGRCLQGCPWGCDRGFFGGAAAHKAGRGRNGITALVQGIGPPLRVGSDQRLPSSLHIARACRHVSLVRTILHGSYLSLEHTTRSPPARRWSSTRCQKRKRWSATTPRSPATAPGAVGALSARLARAPRRPQRKNRHPHQGRRQRHSCAREVDL